MSRLFAVDLYVGCLGVAGCTADSGPECGFVFDHFAADAVDCSGEDDRVGCKAAAEAAGDGWRIRYRRFTIDGGDVPEFVVGTANEEHREVAPYVVARGEHLISDY